MSKRAPALQYRLEGQRLTIWNRLERVETPELYQLLEQRLKQKTEIDLSGVTSMDSSAVACLIRAWRLCREQGGDLHLEAISPEAKRSLGMFRLAPPAPAQPKKPGVLEQLGQVLFAAKDYTVEMLQLAADTTFAMASALWHRSLRISHIAEQGVYMGTQALGIVMLINFILGLTLTLLSAAQLQQFGASIYVADLTAIAMVREMGPLMTAVLIAGRSGSSIAAEIATMKVSEELDALTVMGLDPIDYLALPRLIALCCAMPMLVLFADVAGIIGGLGIGVTYLDIPPVAYLKETYDALSASGLCSGLFKSIVYGWGIGLIGLFYGFRVHGGAGEVGRVTTASVVASIFFIVIVGCLFSILFYMIL